MKRRLLDRSSELVVKLAGAMVPRAQREEWTAEWVGELWQVQQSEQGDTPVDALEFSLGAMRDAFLIGWGQRREALQRIFVKGSAANCIALLVAMAAAGIAVCVALPGSRPMLEPMPYRDADNLVLISRFAAIGKPTPSIRLAEYREWTGDTAGLYQSLAFYAPEAATLRIHHRPAASLTVAVASANLLDVLNLKRAAGVENAKGARLLLTYAAWRRWYRSDRGLRGGMVDVRGQQATLAGVLPDGDWRLPDNVDAILLEDAQDSEQLPATLRGFVVARILPAAFPAPRNGLRSMVEAPYGEELHYACQSLTAIQEGSAEALGCCLLLALFSLPVIAALSVGDYPIAMEAHRAGLVARRYGFLAAKFVLIAVIVAVWSSTLAFGMGSRDIGAAMSAQMAVAFVPLLFGFRWAMRDQRDRCPVCLRKLSHPARVGQVSWSFLGWYGTEMICARGHGLLHIAELPTSWFGAQRWLGLDPSWMGLFEDRAITGSHSG